MRKASKIWYFCLAVTLVLLIFGTTRVWLHAAAREGNYSLENGFGWVKRQVFERGATLFRAQAVLNRLHELEDEVARLRVDAAQLESVAAENRELRRNAFLPERSFRRPERCLVLSRDGALGWWQTLRINKGSSSGIREGDAVVAPEGLVGKICKTSANYSDVLLVTDPNCRIACVLEPVEGKPLVRGILQGGGWSSGGEDTVDSFLFTADPMRLDYLERNSPPGESGNDEMPPRMRVMTSGLSGTIPGGIPVGWLISTEPEPDGLYKTGTVLPAVDMANLTSLFVLTDPGRSP